MPDEAIRIEALPASYGDCLLVSCALAEGGVWRLLVDTGPSRTYATLRSRLANLQVDAAGRRRIDLLVISHIDHDHIGGVSRLLGDDDLNIDYGDIWFNAPTATRSVAEGQRLAEVLGLPTPGRPWNQAFDGGHVVMPADGQPLRHETGAGPVITLLSPTPERLDALFEVWSTELAKLQRGESDPVEREALDRDGFRTRAPTLEELAARRTRLDAAKANGSSIAFLLEHRGASVLLAADAFATVLEPALRTLRASRSLTGPLPIDVFKLSHHGSSANITTDLLTEIDAGHCIVSTDNTRFDHPDDEAMARVVLGQSRAAIWFNHDTEHNRRWSESGLLEGLGREVNYPAAPGTGVVLSLNAMDAASGPPRPAICPRPVGVPPTRIVSVGSDNPVPPATLPASEPAEDASATTEAGPPIRGEPVPEPARRLDVQVVNGDLRFASGPLLIGHYRDSLLSGTEELVDRLCGGALRRSLAARLYPDVIGTHQIFVNRTAPSDNPLGMPRPSAVIVAALGDEGQLKQESLSYAVRQAILGYAQREFERETGPGRSPPQAFRLSSVLLGSGGAGVHAAPAAQMIVDGALEADRMLEVAGWPRLAGLTLIESYLDRAAEAWHALRARQRSMPSEFEVGEQVRIHKGGKRYRIESGYRGTEYDLIRALQTRDAEQRTVISFTVDSHLARTETRAQVAQGPLIRRLVERGSNVAQGDIRIGRTLYNLLVPVELGAVLGGNATTVLELDRNTAAIPWELLDTDEGVEPARRGEVEPWAIRAKLLRKMQTSRPRLGFVPANARDAVLVIGEPRYPPAYPPLEGTRREAMAVLQTFQSHAPTHPVRSLLDKPDAEAVINELHAQACRVIHIAGHGAPGEDKGVVLSDDLFLGPSEVRSLRRVPELVFLNCCHLAHQSADGLLAPPEFDRTRFASNIASELIDAGVRCIVAAGWAVADDAAEVFARTFYASLLHDNCTFLDAVTAARRAARDCGGNTWTAYQCYGDPQWRWDMHRDPHAAHCAIPADGREEIASPAGLAIVLRNIAIDCEFDQAGRPAALQRLDSLAKDYGDRWSTNGEIAEGFGLAFGKAGDEKQARRWYRRAIEVADGSVSTTAFEQYANFAGRVAESEPSEAALAELDQSIELLKRLDGLGQTGERSALIGSAYRRKVLVREHLEAPADAGQLQVWEEAIADDVRQSRKHYAEALERKRRSGSKDAFYPLMNLLAARVRERLLAGGAATAPVADEEWERTSRLCSQADPEDFWSISALHELQMWKAIDGRDLASAQHAVRNAFEDLRQRVPSTYYWKSVRTGASFVVEAYARLAATPDAEREAARGLLGMFDRFVQAG